MGEFQQNRESLILASMGEKPFPLTENSFLCGDQMHVLTACGFEYLISLTAEHSNAEILWESKDLFSEIDTKNGENVLANIQIGQSRWTQFLKLNVWKYG